MTKTRTLLLSLVFAAVTQTAFSQPDETVDEVPDPWTDLASNVFEEWSPALWCKLLTNDDPVVRVMASYQALPAFWNETPLICPEPIGEVDPVQIRSEALQQAPDNPAVLAQVYRADCQGQAAITGCDADAVLERLVSIAPDNAHPYLLALQYSAAEGEIPGALSAQDLLNLNQAAAAVRYDEYAFSGIHDTYLAMQDALPQIPPLTLDEETQRAVDAVYMGDLRLTGSVIMLFAGLIAQGAPEYGTMSRHCRAAASQGETDVVDACLQIADLMRDTARTDMATIIGRGIRRSVSHPELVGAAREDEHPEAWKSSREGLVQQCLRPRGLPGDSRLSGPMPADHLGLFLRDFQNTTERNASRNASIREYALYPEDFVLDPARCEEIYALNENTQQSLAKLWRTNQTGWLDEPNPALVSLAEALQ